MRFQPLADPPSAIAASRESRNSLARAVFIHRVGEIRDRTYENQQHRASGLNLVVTAIVLWNTRYLNRAIAALRGFLVGGLSPGFENKWVVAIKGGRRQPWR